MAKKKSKSKRKLKAEPAIALTEEQKTIAKKLTRLQRRMVLFMVGSNLSQRQAYLAAGGQAKKPHTQDASASEILTHHDVKAFYESLMESAQLEAVMTKAEALDRLSKQARIKITDICTFSYVEIDTPEGPVTTTVWKMKDAEDIDPDVAACIKSVTFTKTGPKLELYDANQSIKILSDMLGWNAPKKQELSNPDGTMKQGPMIDTSKLSKDALKEIIAAAENDPDE